jgi:hypothetical protein
MHGREGRCVAGCGGKTSKRDFCEDVDVRRKILKRVLKQQDGMACSILFSLVLGQMESCCGLGNELECPIKCGEFF